jgi:SAM-dependent methyltransferase
VRNLNPYDASYYATEGPAANLQSAKTVVPIVMSLVQPRSVVDVGCGSGAWLSIFRECGADRILGLDGDYVEPSWLVIPNHCFRAIDLSKPFDVDAKFDLVVCLEVAEHLPKESSAEFVRSLVNLAPIVLFSAAIPLQGGTHHVNEQWPEFWQSLFRRHGYRALDLIRTRIWKNPEVKYWYRQNIFLFVREDLIAIKQEFVSAAQYSDDLLLIHSSIMERQHDVRQLLKRLPKSLWEAVSGRFKRSFH